ncbi:MAG: c-type cytochrome [Paracoccus sp. (in: a-proteobacteria)]|nr:c-type cytochrome [Paracoccus sp. (in: a-proteobacteria)]
MTARRHLSLVFGTREVVPLTLLLLACAAPPSAAQVGDAEYGEYLSGDCTSCHRGEGAVGIPAIVGLHPEAFIEAMRQFRDGTRKNEVMNMMAGRLDDEQIAALAAYFASLDP